MLDFHSARLDNRAHKPVVISCWGNHLITSGDLLLGKSPLSPFSGAPFLHSNCTSARSRLALLQPQPSTYTMTMPQITARLVSAICPCPPPPAPSASQLPPSAAFRPPPTHSFLPRELIRRAAPPPKLARNAARPSATPAQSATFLRHHAFVAATCANLSRPPLR